VKTLETRADSLYEIQLYLAVLYEGFRPQKKLLRSLQYAAEDVAAQAERALEILSSTVRSFQSLTDDLLATEVLHERQARLFLRNLVNYDAAHAALFTASLASASIQRRSIRKSRSMPITCA
jgi:hypothetical protein